jgi:hypothetical protein
VYIGQDLQVAFPSYLNIDDISGSFNSVTTSFALTVNGSTPVPLPINSQQCLISVGGIIQRPDDTGTEGFRLSGSNIVFSSAPNTGEDFFGTILAGADYINAGVNFPDGQSSAPSITFDQDLDTGFFRSSSGAVSFSSNGVNTATLGSNSFTAPSFIPTSSSVPSNGVFLPAANSVAIATNGTQQATVDSSGRLLVGTSSARANFFNSVVSPQFQIEGAGDFERQAAIISSSSTAGFGGVQILAHQKSGAIGGNTLVASGDALGTISFQGSDGTEFVEGARIEAFVDGTPGANDMPGRLVFFTTADGASSPTERMRITKEGYFLYGTTTKNITSPNNPGFETVTQNTGGLGIYSNTTSNSVTSVVFQNPNGRVGFIDINSNSVIYATSSDYRLKENVAPIADGITRLQQLKPSRFDFISDPDNTIDGFLAHEVQGIVPEAITGEKDAIDGDGNPIYQGIDQSKLVPLLTAALQEAVAKIESLEARLTAAGI